jgi:hypothetical protein
MAKDTLIELVQDILSDSDGDEINSISDTIEGQQCATVIRRIYQDIIETYDLQGTETAFKLEASGDADLPTLMRVPSDISDVYEVRYNTSIDAIPIYTVIPYTTPSDFLTRVANNDSSQPNYQDMIEPEGGFTLSIRNDQAPSMWTSFDGGDTLLFNSFDSDVDSTLQTSKTQCLGRKRFDLVIADTTVIDLPEQLQQLLYNEAREMFFELYKDGAPRAVNERARYSRMKMKERHTKFEAPPIERLPDYGRKK